MMETGQADLIRQALASKNDRNKKTSNKQLDSTYTLSLSDNADVFGDKKKSQSKLSNTKQAQENRPAFASNTKDRKIFSQKNTTAANGKIQSVSRIPSTVQNKSTKIPIQLTVSKSIPVSNRSAFGYKSSCAVPTALGKSVSSFRNTQKMPWNSNRSAATSSKLAVPDKISCKIPVFQRSKTCAVLQRRVATSTPLRKSNAILAIGLSPIETQNTFKATAIPLPSLKPLTPRSRSVPLRHVSAKIDTNLSAKKNVTATKKYTRLSVVSNESAMPASQPESRKPVSSQAAKSSVNVTGANKRPSTKPQPLSETITIDCDVSLKKNEPDRTFDVESQKSKKCASSHEILNVVKVGQTDRTVNRSVKQSAENYDKNQKVIASKNLSPSTDDIIDNIVLPLSVDTRNRRKGKNTRDTEFETKSESKKPAKDEAKVVTVNVEEDQQSKEVKKTTRTKKVKEFQGIGLIPDSLKNESEKPAKDEANVVTVNVEEDQQSKEVKKTTRTKKVKEFQGIGLIPDSLKNELPLVKSIESQAAHEFQENRDSIDSARNESFSEKRVARQAVKKDQKKLTTIATEVCDVAQAEDEVPSVKKRATKEPAKTQVAVSVEEKKEQEFKVPVKRTKRKDTAKNSESSAACSTVESNSSNSVENIIDNKTDEELKDSEMPLNPEDKVKNGRKRAARNVKSATTEVTAIKRTKRNLVDKSNSSEGGSTEEKSKENTVEGTLEIHPKDIQKRQPERISPQISISNPKPIDKIIEEGPAKAPLKRRRNKREESASKETETNTKADDIEAPRPKRGRKPQKKEEDGECVELSDVPTVRSARGTRRKKEDIVASVNQKENDAASISNVSQKNSRDPSNEAGCSSAVPRIEITESKNSTDITSSDAGSRVSCKATCNSIKSLVLNSETKFSEVGLFWNHRTRCQQKNPKSMSVLTLFAHEVTGVKCGILEFPPGVHKRKTSHDNCDVMFTVLNGNGIFQLNDEEVPVKTGDMCVVPRGSSYLILNNEESESPLRISLMKLPC